MEPERGQHVAVAPWSTSRDNKDGCKIAKGPEGREQGADEIEVRKKRKSDMDKATDANGPVNFRRVIDVARDGHSGSEKDHGPERHPFPGVSDNICPYPEPPIIEPDRAVDTQPRRQQAIDQTLLLQHPVERDAGLCCRYQPGEDVDSEQSPDPPATAQEEPGEQQG